MGFGARKLYCLTGALCAAAIVVFSLDSAASRMDVTATVRAKFLYPPLTGEIQRPIIAIEANSQLNTTSLTLASGHFGEASAADIERWKLLREGCRYRFTVHNRNVRGRDNFEITGATLLGCS